MFIGFIIIGIVLIVISKSNMVSWDAEDTVEFIGILFLVIGILVSIFTCGFAVGNAVTYDLNYQNALHEKEMLEYRIEHMEENITGNEMLYNDIVEFNNELRNVKKWANNPWTNWFNNQGVASIDYIELSMD
jgi:hypothetical protein